MTLGSEVDDTVYSAKLFARYDLVDHCLIFYTADNQLVARIAVDYIGEVFSMPGIGLGIEIDDLVSRISSKKVANEIASDEAQTASD